MMNGKKRFMRILSFALALGFSLAAFCLCLGAEGTTAQSSATEEPELVAIDLFNTDLSPYIELGKYKDLEMTYNVDVSDQELYTMAVSNNIYTEITSRATKKGDLVNISYVGKIAVSTGKMIPVRGGSGMNTVTLEGVSGDKKTIEDMLRGNEKLIGVEPGKSVDVSVTMPSDYSESAMAGKTVVFTVTVKSIIEYGYTDAYVSSKYGCETVEDFKLIVMKQKLESFNELLRYEVYLNIVGNAEITIPKAQYDYYYASFYNYYKSLYESNASYAQSYPTLEIFIEACGSSLEQIDTSAKLQVERDLVCFAIYKTGAVGNISAAEYQSRLAQLAQENYTTVAEFEAMYEGKPDISNIIIADYTYDKLETLISKLNTNYGDYAYLLEEEETESVTTEGVGGEGNASGCAGVDANVVLMIVLIAVGFVGCVVLVILQRRTAKKAEAEEKLEEELEEEELEEEELEEEELEEEELEEEELEEEELEEELEEEELYEEESEEIFEEDPEEELEENSEESEINEEDQN